MNSRAIARNLLDKCENLYFPRSIDIRGKTTRPIRTAKRSEKLISEQQRNQYSSRVSTSGQRYRKERSKQNLERNKVTERRVRRKWQRKALSSQQVHQPTWIKTRRPERIGMNGRRIATEYPKHHQRWNSGRDQMDKNSDFRSMKRNNIHPIEARRKTEKDTRMAKLQEATGEFLGILDKVTTSMEKIRIQFRSL